MNPICLYHPEMTQDIYSIIKWGCVWEVDLTPKLKEILKLVGLEIDSGTNKRVNYKSIQITLHKIKTTKTKTKTMQVALSQ